MDITALIGSLLDGLTRKIIESIVEPGINALLDSLSSSYRISEFFFFDTLHQGSLVIGIALLTTITMWSLFKSYFAFTGIEADDPLHIGLQLIGSYFMVWYSKDILLFIVDLNGSFGEVITNMALNTPSGSRSISTVFIGALAYFTTGPLSVTLFSWLIIPIIYLLYKLVRLLLRMFQRMVLVAFLVIASPMAFAAGISKSTRGFQVGFIRVFAGNLVIQLLQTMCLMAIGMYATADLASIPNLITISGILFVLDRLEDIVRDMSLSVGVGREMGGAMQTLNSSSMAFGSYQTLTRYLPLPRLPGSP